MITNILHLMGKQKPKSKIKNMDMFGSINYR